MVPLSNFTAVQSQTFGQLLVQGSDDIMRTLTGPAVANLYPRTNAAGQITFETLPTATVPDPLVVNNLTVVTNAKVADLQITGTATATGLATGTLTNIVGLNSSNELIKGTIAVTGSQCAMFFENPTSPGIATPNLNITAGQPCTIGNLLFDSAWPNGVVGAGVLITATNIQTLTVLTAGTYVIDFGALTIRNGQTTANFGVQLSINGIVVNNGNNSTVATNLQNVTHNFNPQWGQEMRRLVAGDVIQIIAMPANPGNTFIFAVRCNFTRLGA